MQLTVCFFTYLIKCAIINTEERLIKTRKSCNKSQNSNFDFCESTLQMNVQIVFFDINRII